MNSNTQHPKLELLDKLRAGLLDDAPDLSSELHRHVETCAVCRRQSDWGGLVRRLGAAHPLPEARLAVIRRQALHHGRTSHRHSPATGRLALAASLAAIFVVTFALLPHGTRAPDARQPGQAVAESPDLYENIDFYLWLADHHENTPGGQHSGDRTS